MADKSKADQGEDSGNEKTRLDVILKKSDVNAEAEKEIMLDEFMHNFGESSVGIKNQHYGMCSYLEQTHLIPEKHRTGLEGLKSHGPWFFKEILDNIIEFYDKLAPIVEEQYKEREQHSLHFQVTFGLVQQLGEIVDVYRRLAQEAETDEALVVGFKDHISELGRNNVLEKASGIINSLDYQKEVYDRAVDHVESRKRWMEKHPEWDKTLNNTL